MKSITAHRGLSSKYAENTLSAFKHAAAINSDIIELDVQFTKDHQLVVIHDENILRVTNINQNVNNYSLGELQEIPLSGLESSEHIPSFREVLTLLDSVHFKGILNIEFKTNCYRYTGIEQATAHLLNLSIHPFTHLYSSFNLSSLISIASCDAQAERAWIMHGNPELFKIAAHLDLIQAIHPESKALLAVPEVCKSFPKKIRPWTVNTQAEMIQLLKLPSINGIITDFADTGLTLTRGHDAK